MNLTFFDCETTGLEAKDRLIQVAYSLTDGPTEPNVEYFKPDLPIPFMAMSVHGITEEAVKDKPKFKGSNTQKFLQYLSKESILVAHNAKFDLSMLAREEVVFPNYIDTLRVARHLLDQESYKLQYLRYSLDLNVQGTAHDAAGDVKVLKVLFDHLSRLVMMKGFEGEGIIEEMMRLTLTPVLIKKFAFGKYLGQNFSDVVKYDRKYLAWLYNAESSKPKDEQDEDLVYTVKNYL